MRLVVLGSGTSVPHPKRSSSAFWLDSSLGSLLLDCSASAVHRMAQEGLDWAGLDAIWISHFHLDHVGGLAPLLFGMKHAPETQSRTKPLKVFGARGLGTLLKTFSDAGNYGLLKLPFPLEVIEIEGLEKFEMLDGLQAVAWKSPHTENSYALHLAGPSTFVFTADTGFDERLAALARRVDLLLIECSFVRNKPVKKHLELAEAMHIIRRAEPKRALLTHLYPEWDNVDAKAEIERFQSATEVYMAYDGLRIEI